MKLHYIPFLFLAILTVSCGQNRRTQLPTDELQIQIDRFEKDLFSVDIYDFDDGILQFHQKYPIFFPLFAVNVVEIGSPLQKGFSSRLKAFVTDFTIFKVSKRVEELYPDLLLYEKELGKAFSMYQHYFPNREVPRVVSCISGFNQSVITSDSLLAISLDKYLGTADEFYRLLDPPIPAYLKSRMNPVNIVPDAMLAWIITEFEYNDEPDNLLGQMIYNGRALYCTEMLLPEISDSLLWGFTQKQMQFVGKNEKHIWEYLVEHKKLFITDAFTISQFIADAPFTKDFTQESPGKTAVWIGYRIVKSYMKRNKDTTLEELMMETDYQKILNYSRYNP